MTKRNYPQEKRQKLALEHCLLVASIDMCAKRVALHFIHILASRYPYLFQTFRLRDPEFVFPVLKIHVFPF